MILITSFRKSAHRQLAWRDLTHSHESQPTPELPIFLHTALLYGTAQKFRRCPIKGGIMRNKEPSPIGRLRKHVRARFDAITNEELPQEMRDLVEKLRQAELVKPPFKNRKPHRKEVE
jgi:hypothetical protein